MSGATAPLAPGELCLPCCGLVTLAGDFFLLPPLFLLLDDILTVRTLAMNERYQDRRVVQHSVCGVQNGEKYEESVSNPS